jgi:hypothetical protein
MLCLLVFYSLGLFLFCSWELNTGYNFSTFNLFQFTLRDSVFPGLCPPATFDSNTELKKEGIISYIEEKLRDGKAIKIAFSGDNVEETIVLLYFYFQDAIFKKRITIHNRREADVPDADYIVTKDSDLVNEKDLLRNYRVLSRIKERVFLIKK